MKRNINNKCEYRLRAIMSQRPRQLPVHVVAGSHTRGPVSLNDRQTEMDE